MRCVNCETKIGGDYQLPLYFNLDIDEQHFILNFFTLNGSIKEIAKQENVSYPTMKNKINKLIEKIKELEYYKNSGDIKKMNNIH
jgi:hypothetical protein